MPVLTDQNDFAQLYQVQNQSQFSKLAVYFALNQIERIPQMEVYSKMFGDIPWQPNMGTTLQGLRVEPTPKVRGTFRPAVITGRANKDVFDQRENKEQAVLYWHKFESPLIYFLRNFQDYIKEQIKPAMEDVNEQVVFANDIFIRTYMWDRSPKVYLSRVDGAYPYVDAPSVSVHNPGNTDPKNAAWVANQIPLAAGYLSLPVVQNAMLALINDAGAAPLNGASNALPKENDLLQGKYCMITSTEAASQWVWDEPAMQNLRNQNEDYIRNKFLSGPLFGQLVVKGEQFPLRFDATGAPVAPQIFEENTGETYPNPAYADPNQATHEVAWIFGKDAYRSVKIGPPPKEFAGGSATSKQVNGMNWNGKVRLTDKILLKAVVNGETVYEPNAYGEYLRIICALTMGCLPGRPRSAFPIIFRRRRVNEAN